MAPPICGSVPVPNSSTSSSVAGSAWRIICFMFVRWLEYVLRSSSMLCSSPMSMNMLPNTPVRERSPTGTERPHCSMYCTRPTVFRHTDLPPALGPEIISIRFSCVSVMSSGTTALPCLPSERASSGWTARIQSMCGLGLTAGSIPLMSWAKLALAFIRSIVARNLYDSNIGFTWGRTSFAKSVSMRIISRRSSDSSSLILLFASTTSAGSMNTVLPDADSSCTIPRMRRFSPCVTGITRRPSRMAGVTSLSTRPSLWAERSIPYSVRDMLPSVRDSSRRMFANSGEALSFIRPNLSSIRSIACTSCGKVRTSAVRRWRAGYG